jgi:hypothetical protein
MREKDLKEDLATLAYKAEADHEVQMARSDLYKIAKYSIKLHEMMKGVTEEQGIEGWVQSKITKASDYLSSVYHYLDYEMKFDEMTEAKKAKPDFADIDDDDNTTEPMKKAAQDKKEKEKEGGKDKKKDLSKVPPQLRKSMENESYEDDLRNLLDMYVHLETESKKKSEKTLVLEDFVGKPITEEQFDEAAGKKDACYHKVKARYKVWPSAYASGALVQCRKKGAKNWGSKSK